MPPFRLALLLGLAACGSDEIGLQEQQAAAAAVRSLEAAVIAAELAAPARLPLDEDATTCPGMSIIQGYTSLSYGDCVPDRGWVRPALQGDLRLDLSDTDFETDVDDLGIDEVLAAGALSGELAAGGALTAELDLQGALYDSVTLDLTATLGEAAVLTGTVNLIADNKAQEVVFTDVEVPGGSGCFVATSGQATLEQGITTVTVAFADDGSATAENDRGDSGSLDICGLGATLWTESGD